MSAVRALALAFGLAALLAGSGTHAQGTSETQRKLEKLKRELKDVAAQRRRTEGQRGDASRGLRAADEQVGRSARELQDTESRIAKGETDLVALQARRSALQSTLGQRREELAGLLRAAYTVGEAAPLKLMLAQDGVADAHRLLAYHRYLQRDRVQRIAALSAELARSATRSNSTIVADAPRARRRARPPRPRSFAQVTRDRQERADVVARLDRQVPRPARARTGAGPRCEGAGKRVEAIARRRRAPNANAARPPPAPRAPPKPRSARASRFAPARRKRPPTPTPRRSRSAGSAGRCRAACSRASAAPARRPPQFRAC